jgi:hypothetical protein
MFMSAILTKFYISTSNEFKNYIVDSYCGLAMCIRKQQKEVVQYYIKSHRKWFTVTLTDSKVFSFLKPHGISIG